MILEVNKEDEINVEKYIGEDYYKCLYLYLDFKKYGVHNKNIKMWVQKGNTEIVLLVMKYYTGMHIYSKDMNFDVDELINLMLNEKPTMICGEKRIINKIEPFLKSKNYQSEYGWVREMSIISGTQNFDNIFRAFTENEFKEITDLLMNDKDIGSSYTIDTLLDQIIERNKQKYGRNYVVKKDNILIAHAGTGAENDKVAILNYVITKPEYRGKGYATRVCSAVCKDLIDEGKKVYLINYSNESSRLYDKIGFRICCEWGKLFLDLKKV